jgi:hypothetical protein
MKRLAVAGAMVVTACGLSGCNTDSLSKVELVVHFAPGTPESDHVAALNACSDASPEAKPEPIVTSNLPSQSVGDVRFRIDHANDHEVAQLEMCLAKQAGVVGFDTPDLTN